MVIAGEALAAERRDFSERLTRHINIMVAPSIVPAGVYHVNTDMGLLRIEAGNANTPLDAWGAEIAIPDHTGAYGERIEELAHEADREGFSINEKSRADFWDFVASPPTEHIAEVTLSDSGLLWASWHRAGGGVIEVEFLGDGRYVAHCDAPAAYAPAELDNAQATTMERAREIVAQASLRSAEEAYS